MPLEPALNFQNEADFTSRFLVPLLRRLGYSIVAEYHGQREFGKDLVFGEIDRFGEVAYHGLQAKYQDSISQSDSEKLIDDCRQAFRHPFQHPTTGAEHRICTFVVANAGNIADNARTNFFTAATNSEHGGAVRMFDGKALLALDRWATMNRVENVAGVLSGLLIELRRNRVMSDELTTRMKQWIEKDDTPLPVERLWVRATSHYIQKPVLHGDIDIRIAESYVHFLDNINRFLDLISSLGTRESKLSMAKGVVENLSYTKGIGNILEASVNATLATLGPLAAL